MVRACSNLRMRIAAGSADSRSTVGGGRSAGRSSTSSKRSLLAFTSGRAPFGKVLGAAVFIFALFAVTPATSNAAGSGGSGQGVTKSTIRIGVSYVDLAAIRNLTTLDDGNFKEAFTAVINNINAHGGVDGRKMVPYFEAVSPLGTAPAAAACAQLTEDDKVFAVLGLFLPGTSLCYTSTHDTPIVGFYPLTAEEQAQAKAPWFLDELNNSSVIPKEIQAFNSKGVFKGHKVAVVTQVGDQSDMTNYVLPELKKLGVNVVQTAINDVSPTDTAGLYQEYALIAQKFQAVGATEVVAVGEASNSWPTALVENHSTYQPRLIATNYSVVQTYINGTTGYNPIALSNAVSASSIPPASVTWNDPSMRSCVAVIRKAYPSDAIGNPVTASTSAPVTWTAPEEACQLITLFVDMAKAAGPTLNNATFKRGGLSLTNVAIPGAGGDLHFGPGHQDGNGPIFLYTWDSSGTHVTSKAAKI